MALWDGAPHSPFGWIAYARLRSTQMDVRWNEWGFAHKRDSLISKG